MSICLFKTLNCLRTAGVILNRSYILHRRLSIMATPRKIHLEIEDTGIFKFKPQTQEVASRTSELLQENHDNHHIFFNSGGFHNHLAHHLLTLYGVGASREVIEKQYKNNLSYQRKMPTFDEQAVKDMNDPEAFQKFLGKEGHYSNFLTFFKNEMDKKGWETVLNEYLFSQSEVAELLFTRMYAGFLHPLIHLGFGVEFKQPAIIAEALAQAAVHDGWITAYLLETEKASQTPTSKNIPELIDEIRADTKVTNAATWADANKIRDGTLKRAHDEMINYAKQWTVSADNLDVKTAEMINASVYFTAAAQRPPKQVKFDFYYMHCVNASIFFPTFNAQPWLSTEAKVRLLKFKVYVDLVMYASRKSPPLLMEEVATYVPKLLEAGDAEWPGLFRRIFEIDDDGHAVKLARAVAYGEKMMEENNYDGEEWAMIKGFMWEKVGNMVADSVEDSGATWVRSAGFEEAWTDFEDRPRKDKI